MFIPVTLVRSDDAKLEIKLNTDMIVFYHAIEHESGISDALGLGMKSQRTQIILGGGAPLEVLETEDEINAMLLYD